ncbi:S8 family serine peptidase [Oscillatoria sp. FACHB-1407]|uniref:S8 family serine peptidase n=1 Tax=Oscillatoria sp. FACHB-1407 TaxID=2692847 RepID=UPI001688AA92|nr:S8 family serine peptidase [Oscillatoria sp. FACHB-1407]MBD2460186.1 S8 family serine peptidase [Oscillatoria sp. FACHB-1407]
MAQWRTAKRLAWFVGGIAASLASAPVLASVSSIGEGGIDALRLRAAPFNLTGAKIAIGQVEIGRPAQFGLDKAGATNLDVVVGRLFHQDALARANDFVDGHAANVASVMISQDKEVSGVAPSARLYSSAVGFIRRSGQPQECLASQTVALQNGGDVRATNFSFGESLLQDPRPDAVLDGNALLTQCVDWSAQIHDVLYVIAGNQGRGGIPIPTDNFNGITVANSTQVDGVFRKVDFSNLGSEPTIVVGRSPDSESNVGPRRSVSLVAPGTNIEMLNPDGSPTRATGTSFSAPHVTATVALIQEYGDRQIRERQPRWGLDARRHQVTKVVLMNSADKIQDRGDGLLLGMSRTLVDQANTNWLESDAYRDPKIPLHAELGTGHLNAYRAIQQFSPGQWSSDAPVPAIGWDYSSVSEGDGATSYRDYVIEQPLQGESFVSVTLAWNRPVELQDANGNGQYDIGETFTEQGLNNLDIYLMRAEDTDVADSIWSSVSEVDSVEHIFRQVPETGRYKIRVVYRDRVNDATQNYAIAWWAMPAR